VRRPPELTRRSGAPAPGIERQTHASVHEDIDGEITDEVGNLVHRFEGDDCTSSTLDTRCANGPNTDFVVSVSNLPTGDLAVLDATYDYSVVKLNS
jgi:hypothetical protein